MEILEGVERISMTDEATRIDKEVDGSLER